MNSNDFEFAAMYRERSRDALRPRTDTPIATGRRRRRNGQGARRVVRVAAMVMISMGDHLLRWANNT